LRKAKSKFNQYEDVHIKTDLSAVYSIEALKYNEDNKYWQYRIRMQEGDTWVHQDLLVPANG
jgi:hypothetical protein